jgi:hypothetical protein
MNDTGTGKIDGEMSSGDALALRSTVDGWLSRDAIDEHTLAHRTLAESTARARALQRMQESEALRLLPIVTASAEDDLQRLVQGVRDSAQRHFELRMEALTETFTTIIEALVDNPESLVRLVTRLASVQIGELPAHSFVLEIPANAADSQWLDRLRSAAPWSRVSENTAIARPRLRIEAPADAGTPRLISLDPEAVKAAVGECLRAPSSTTLDEDA